MFTPPSMAVVFTAFKNPHRLYEKTSCFAVISQDFFSQLMPCDGMLIYGILKIFASRTIGGVAQVHFREQAIGIFSSNKLSGFEKSREFWVQQEKAGKTQFEYVVLYSIDKDNFQEQIDRALGKIAAKSEQEKEALSRINELVKMSALRATSEPEER